LLFRIYSISVFSLLCFFLIGISTSAQSNPSDKNFCDRGNKVRDNDCIDCHQLLGSHLIHTEANPRGPASVLDCLSCHHSTHSSLFADGLDFVQTAVCNDCHSPGGSYNGVNDDAGGSIGAKDHWNDVYSADGVTLPRIHQKWCVGCHDSSPAIIDGVAAPDVSQYFNVGHGRPGAGIKCLDCHDVESGTHIDSEHRTFSFDTSQYAPAVSGVHYAAGYRLGFENGQVPMMIPANFGVTFNYDQQFIKTDAFRLCFRCHDSSRTLDDSPGDGIDSNFKASLPNPPRNYSYAWGSGADLNEHVSHLINYTGAFSDSDWDPTTQFSGDYDSMVSCITCHNVHGVTGTEGSTNAVMIRDGSLAGRTGFGFSHVIEDVASGGFPFVTSNGANKQNSVGSIMRTIGNSEMCASSMCHGNPAPPPASSFDATGSGWGTYLEYYRPWNDYTTGGLVAVPTPALTSYFRNYPNPFNPTTMLVYRLDNPTVVNLRIYDLNGRLVQTLVQNQHRESGEHRSYWNGRNSFGRSVASGIYFARLQAGVVDQTLRMVLVK